MTGTIVNAAAVVAGGALGLCLRRGLPERVQDAAMQAGGLGVAMTDSVSAMAQPVKASANTSRAANSFFMGTPPFENGVGYGVGPQPGTFSGCGGRTCG